MIFGCTDVTSNTIMITINPMWNWVTTLVFERMGNIIHCSSRKMVPNVYIDIKSFKEPT